MTTISADKATRKHQSVTDINSAKAAVSIFSGQRTRVAAPSEWDKETAPRTEDLILINPTPSDAAGWIRAARHHNEARYRMQIALGVGGGNDMGCPLKALVTDDGDFVIKSTYINGLNDSGFRDLVDCSYDTEVNVWFTGTKVTKAEIRDCEEEHDLFKIKQFDRLLAFVKAVEDAYTVVL